MLTVTQKDFPYYDDDRTARIRRIFPLFSNYVPPKLLAMRKFSVQRPSFKQHSFLRLQSSTIRSFQV